MNLSNDTDLKRIADGIRDLSLPKADWTHEAHWAAALWLLGELGDEAFSQMPEIIRAYNEATGVANTDHGGYHETITLASLKAARAWLAEAPGEERVIATLDRLMASEMGNRDWLLTYWSREVLFSVAARRRWVEADQRAFPF